MKEKDPMEEMLNFKTKDFIQILENVYTLGFQQCYIPMKTTMKTLLDQKPDLSVLSKFLIMMDEEVQDNKK